LERLSPLQRWRAQQESWVDPEAVIDRHMFTALQRVGAERRLQQQGLEAQPTPQEPAPSLADSDLADRG
jgi:hypothetical protein